MGGGPAGSFFTYFLLQTAGRVGLDLEADVYEPKDFQHLGPAGCNMCGGILSESLLQHLAAEGINIPRAVIQRRLDSYTLHMDVGSVRIETPLREKRIAAVHRGSGPRGVDRPQGPSFDGYLLDLATSKGAHRHQERVTEVSWEDGRPRIKTQKGLTETYDLLAVAIGVNSPALKMFEGTGGLAFEAPRTTKTHICEFYLGRDVIKRYLGDSMHVFLLDLPGLEFAAIIPKGDFATACLLGSDIDKEMVDAFLGSPEVKACMPPQWQAPSAYCHCSPKINVLAAREPFADRLVFLGDSGATRLYKDGIGAAYRTAKAAALAAVLEGISAETFRHYYLPACRRIESDNRLGKVVFSAVHQIQKWPIARRGISRMVTKEQDMEGKRRRMSLVLWDTFTGSSAYRSVLTRSLHPAFLGRLGWSVVAGSMPRRSARQKRSKAMTMDQEMTGFMGRYVKDGDVVYRQGEQGKTMFVIQKGQVELRRREGDQEFCLATLEDGDFFGTMALFGEPERQQTAVAVGEVWVLSLQKEALLRRINEDPSLALRMMEQMAHRIQELESALVALGARRAATDPSELTRLTHGASAGITH
jgi:flavin-dependent dehydrogenase